MHSSTVFARVLLGLTLSVAATGQSTDAPVVTDNQPGTFYHATLLEKDNTTVSGSISISSSFGSPALQVDVILTGIPEGEYLTYHIHQSPIPEDGNCYSTGAHLDPYNRGDKTPCTITAPQTCQVGDLSGKHAPAYAPPGEVFRVSYADFFLSNVPGQPAYFGDLSVVVHAANGSRLTCGNFGGGE